MTASANIYLPIFLKLSAIAVLTSLFSACNDYEIDDPWSVEGNGNNVTIKAECLEMLPQFIDPSSVGARGTDPKLEEEKAVNILHIFFFSDTPDANGKHPLLDPTLGTNNFRPYQRIETNVLSVPQLAFTSTLDQSLKARVYAVANIPGKFNAAWNAGAETDGNILDGNDFWNQAQKEDFATMTEEQKEAKIAEIKAKTKVYEITCLEDLEAWIYLPELRSDVSKLPEKGMPMTGSKTIDNIAQNTGNIIIPMKAMMARVDISVELHPNQKHPTNAWPAMTITEYGVKNMPVMVPFKSLNTSDTDRMPDSETTPYPVVNRTVKVEQQRTIVEGSTPEQFCYYTYENIQNRNPDAMIAGAPAYDGNGEVKYPEGITDDVEKQRWKPAIARTERASAMVLRAHYITHQGLQYDAMFTAYMGKNPVNDFRVTRNCQYNNNISISGLDYVRNSQEDVYTFDGRVNVVTNNPIYLAIVNERKVDAHASVRPMDVWFLLREQNPDADWWSDVTLTILEPEKTNWLRMELIERDQMEASNFAPGTGCRPYFTTNLVTETLKDNHTLQIKSTPQKNNSRSRVYFYIDENCQPVNNNGDIPDRIANIKIVYNRRNSENGEAVDTRERILQIEQRGLLKVSVAHPSNSTALTDTYIEQYEEYLEHYDPLDKHIMDGSLYSGLPWGVSGRVYYSVQTGTFLGRPTYTYYNSSYRSDKLGDVYDEGLQATQWILYSRNTQYNSDYVPMSTIRLYNETPPSTAYHYCYGKNKRNDDGSVPNPANNNYQNTSNGGWYLPGIREIERALVQYYVNFSDFRDYFYWSASADKDESSNYARATKAIMNNGNISYAESRKDNEFTGHNGTGGRATRQEKLRIRAFYRLPSDWRNHIPNQ